MFVAKAFFEEKICENSETLSFVVISGRKMKTEKSDEKLLWRFMYSASESVQSKKKSA